MARLGPLGLLQLLLQGEALVQGRVEARGGRLQPQLGRVLQLGIHLGRVQVVAHPRQVVHRVGELVGGLPGQALGGLGGSALLQLLLQGLGGGVLLQGLLDLQRLGGLEGLRLGSLGGLEGLQRWWLGVWLLLQLRRVLGQACLWRGAAFLLQQGGSELRQVRAHS